MFERFTDRARTVVVLAQEEARGLDHNYIGTEHLLLGLLAEGNGVGAKVLDRAGIRLDDTRAEVVRIIGRSDPVPVGHIPFTPRAKKALECALREALRLQHNYIGTEHVLLGLLEEGSGVAAQILSAKGLSLVEARSLVMDALGTQGSSPPVVTPWRGGGAVRGRVARQQNTTPAVADLYRRARELAGDDPVSSAHMLRALVALPDSRAARALAALGVTGERVEGALAATPTEGTTDETPRDAIVRAASISTREGRVVIELDDEELVRRIGADTVELTGSLADALEQLHEGLVRQSQQKGPGAAASTEG